MRPSGSWIGGLVLFAAGAAAGWAVRTLLWKPEAEASETGEGDEAPPLEVASADMRVVVTTVEATQRELPLTLVAPGIVRAAPAAERAFASRAGGRVLELLVAPGQPVKQGELLLRIDPTSAQTTLSRARAALAEHSNRLAQFERTGSARQELELQGNVQSAISRAALLEAQVARLEPLRADGLVSEKALAEARLALELARAERDASEQAQRAFAGTGQALQLATLAAARDAAELEAREAERALGEVDVRAPSDGRVVEWSVKSGELLAAGAPLGRWLASAGRELSLQVPASEASRLSAGRPVAWKDSRGVERRGTLIRLDAVVEPETGMLQAFAKPDEEDGSMLVGLRVLAEIELGRLTSAVLVPDRAVLRAD